MLSHAHSESDEHPTCYCKHLQYHAAPCRVTGNTLHSFLMAAVSVGYDDRAECWLRYNTSKGDHGHGRGYNFCIQMPGKSGDGMLADGPVLRSRIVHALLPTMTRYTNVGRKRTYLQASFNPNDDQIASNVASTSSSRSPDAAHTLHESSVDAHAESRRKRPRKSKEISEEKSAAEPGPATADGDGSRNNSQVTKSERKKKALAKLKAKAKAKRTKSACLFVGYIHVDYDKFGDGAYTAT